MQALVTRVFVEYIHLMRKVQTTYWCAVIPCDDACVACKCSAHAMERHHAQPLHALLLPCSVGQCGRTEPRTPKFSAQ